MVMVKNLNNTSGREPKDYDSWLEFWEAKTGKKANKCACCPADAEVGAHVKKDSVFDNEWYIIPLCNRCNQKPSEDRFYVAEEMVPVNP